MTALRIHTKYRTVFVWNNIKYLYTNPLISCYGLFKLEVQMCELRALEFLIMSRRTRTFPTFHTTSVSTSRFSPDFAPLIWSWKCRRVSRLWGHRKPSGLHPIGVSCSWRQCEASKKLWDSLPILPSKEGLNIIYRAGGWLKFTSIASAPVVNLNDTLAGMRPLLNVLESSYSPFCRRNCVWWASA